jgi:hypothetical protein
MRTEGMVEQCQHADDERAPEKSGQGRPRMMDRSNRESLPYRR